MLKTLTICLILPKLYIQGEEIWATD